MSIQIAKKQIEKFLASSESEVIVIKGKWGTGKTFLWNKILKQAKDSDAIDLKYYSYVSLFGLSSIEILKDRIFENQILKELIGEPVNFETFSNNISSTFGHLIKKGSKPLINVISQITNKYFSGSKDTLPISSSIFYMSLKQTIVCFDDIERKDRKLTQNEILGLVSDLKYQKKCKIVLIFNEAAFSDDDKKLYEELREKIVE